MKTLFFLLLTFLTLLSVAAQAAFYRWVDADGVVHFTDDRKKIPAKYRNKAKKVRVMEDSAAGNSRRGGQEAGRGAGGSLPAPQRAGESVLTPGGHDEHWWRERFISLRKELALVRQNLSRKQTQLVELRRRRAIFTRVEDREAVNAMQSSISADETRVAELLRQIDDLEQQAARDGVPIEWRQ